MFLFHQFKQAHLASFAFHFVLISITFTQHHFPHVSDTYCLLSFDDFLSPCMHTSSIISHQHISHFTIISGLLGPSLIIALNGVGVFLLPSMFEMIKY